MIQLNVNQLDPTLLRVQEPLSWSNLTDPEYLIAVAIQVGLIVGLSWISYWILRMMLRRLEVAAGPGDSVAITLEDQRIVTLIGLIRSVGAAVIGMISVFMILQVFQLPIGPLLGGAGVIGLAISFGSQTLVRDIISGLFILFENQFGVGDVIRVADVSGRVEKMTLRVVVLRDLQGALHVVPNGEITRVSNLTRGFSRAVIEMGVAYSEDVDRVLTVMREVGDEFWNDMAWRPFLTEEPTVPGIESFSDVGVNIRMLATTLPLKQWDVARELRRRLKLRFDQEQIAIALSAAGRALSPAPPRKDNLTEPAGA